MSAWWPREAVKKMMQGFSPASLEAEKTGVMTVWRRGVREWRREAAQDTHNVGKMAKNLARQNGEAARGQGRDATDDPPAEGEFVTRTSPGRSESLWSLS